MRSETHDIKQKFIHITSQIMFPIAIYTAVKLNIADCLYPKGKNIKDLAQDIRCQPKTLLRLMRYLVYKKIFTLDEAGLYHLNEFSQYLLADHPNSQKNLLLIFNERAMHSFLNLYETIVSNEPSYKALYGEHHFVDLSMDLDAGKIYDAAMANYSEGEGKIIVNSYDFSSFNSIADLGGGHSDLLAEIKKIYPKMIFTLFDQPQVINNLKKTNPENIELVEGDFFKKINVSADCMIMKRVLHDWDDKSCIKILKNCRKQMTTKTKLLIIDALIPNKVSLGIKKERFDEEIILGLDLQLLCLYGGVERTQTDFEQLYKKSNLILKKIIPTNCLVSIMELGI